jgi:hypothetical protein
MYIWYIAILGISQSVVTCAKVQSTATYQVQPTSLILKKLKEVYEINLLCIWVCPPVYAPNF